MVNLGKAVGYLDLDTTGFKKGFDSAVNDLKALQDSSASVSDKLSGVGSSMKKIGTNLTVGATIPLVTAGTTAVKFATDFDSGMKKVATIADTSVKSIEEIGDEVLALSSDTNTSTDVLNEALYQTLSATNDTANAMEYLDIAAKLAKGGFTEVTSAVDGATSVMNAYGESGTESFQKIADIMITTQNLGKTTVDELSKSLFNVIPTAASAGISFEQVGAALATITAQGTPTSVATTQLRSAMQAFISPNKQMVDALEETINNMVKEEKLSGSLVDEYVKQRKFLNDLVDEKLKLNKEDKEGAKRYKVLEGLIEDQNKEVDELAGGLGALVLEELGLQDALGVVTEATNGNKDAMTQAFGSVEGMNAALQLTSEQGAAKYIDSLKGMEDAAGATEEAFETMSSSAEDKFKSLVNELKNLAIELGQVILPVVIDIVEIIAEWLKGFKDLDDESKEFIVKIGLIVAAVGPLLSMGGNLLSGIGSLINTLPSLGGAITKVFSLATSPVGLAITAMGTLVGLIALAKETDLFVPKGYEEFFSKIDSLVEKSKELRTETDNVIESYESSISSIDDRAEASLAELDYVEDLVEQLSNLATETGEVKAKDEEYVRFILEDLNEALGTKYELIDGQITGYEDLKESVYDLIEAEKARILFEVQEDKYKEAVRAQIDLTEQAEETIANIDALETKLSELQQSMAEKALYDPDSFWRSGYLTMGIDSSLQFLEGSSIREQELINEINSNRKSLSDIGENLLIAEEDVNNYEAALDILKSGAENANEQIINSFSSSASEIKSIQDSSYAELEAAKIENNEKIKSLEDIKNEALDEASKASWEAIIKNAKDYGDKLEQEMDRRDNLRNVSNENMDEYIDAITQKSSVLGVTISNMVYPQLQKLDMYYEAKTSGENTMQGYFDGINSRVSVLGYTMSNVAYAAIQSFNDTLDINSPSRVFKKSGEYTIQGAMEGALSEEDSLKETYASLAMSAIKEYNKNMNDISKLSKESNASVFSIVDADDNVNSEKASSYNSNDSLNSPIFQFYIYADGASTVDEMDMEEISRGLGEMFVNDLKSRGVVYAY